MLKSKIHRATVTGVEPDYEGSIKLDPLLMDAAAFFNYEQVHVWDITNGNRFVTYAIAGEKGSGEVCLNGAAARLVYRGDKIIISSFVSVTEEEAKEMRPIVVKVGGQNEITEVLQEIEIHFQW